MSLGRKLLVLFAALGLALCAGSFFVMRASVLATFEDVERKASIEAISRATQLLESKLEALSIINVEYSAWDDTAQYLEDRNATYQEENLSPGNWLSIDVDFVGVFDESDQLVYGWGSYPGRDEVVAIESVLTQAPRAGDPLLEHADASSQVLGLLETRSGILMISSQPVTRHSSAGDVVGTLMLGQFLTPEFINVLSRQATVGVSVYELGSAGSPAHVVAAADELRRSGDSQTVMTSETNVRGLTLLRDVYGEPVAVLEARLPREIMSIGKDLIYTTVLFLAIGSIGFLLSALFFLRHLIVEPIEALTRNMLRMRETGDLQMDIDQARTDELGVLAGQFAELTSGLEKARRDLETARDEALSSSRAKSEFLARMSHEIRTPMNGVLGMTELLQSTKLDRKQRRFASTIYSSAESLLHIINDILDISKIEAGKVELDIAPFNLRHLVEECLDMLADAAHRKDLELVGAISPDTHICVEGDALRLRQVLVNLLGNAVKFTEHGEIVVRVDQESAAGDELTYRFEVEDTGIGIDSTNIEKVFEPFAQEDGSTTRRFGGTGLGLSICKQLLEIMGGTIGVDSRPGHGCRFWFTVTLKKDPCSPELLQADLLAGKRALVVDDNATNLYALRLQLEAWGMHVETSASAPEALGILASVSQREAPFDVILLDMNMPGMDGIELATEIRASAQIIDAPQIMLSSVSAGDCSEQRNLNGIDAWLTKPVRHARLHDALVSHLGRFGTRNPERVDKPSDVAVNDQASRSLRVLLAEDNIVNQQVALSMLQKLGHQATVVTDGREAVAARQDDGFDVVLMDCQMPGMDGLEATREIRRWEKETRKPRIIVIAVTANALSGDRERCLAADMDDYLSKPFTLQGLAAMLAKYATEPPREQEDDQPPVDKSAHM